MQAHISTLSLLHDVLQHSGQCAHQRAGHRDILDLSSCVTHDDLEAEMDLSHPSPRV